MTPDRIGLLLVATALLGIGTFFVLHLGLGSLRRLRAWEAGAVRTTATVTRHEARTYKGNTYYHPVARFVTPTGEEVVFEADRPRRGPEPPAGFGLEVLYDPQRPSAVRLPGQDRTGALFMTAVGVVFLVVGVTMAAAVWSR
jgi:hypothetical protein